MNSEKIEKIVNLAKNGSSGERENAIRIIKKICKKSGLNFEDVMLENKKEKDHFLKFSNPYEKIMIFNLIAKFAKTTKFYSYKLQRNKVYFYCTDNLYIDTLNAWEILRRQMRVEMKSLAIAMIHKHRLFPEESDKIKRIGKEKELTEEERREMIKQQTIAEGLDDVEINKMLN